MSRVPDLVPDSDTGAAMDMVTKTIDRFTADTVATGGAAEAGEGVDGVWVTLKEIAIEVV